MATFLTLYNETLRRAHLDVAADANQTTQAKNWVNWSQRQIQTMRRWNVLYRRTSFITTSGTENYTLGARSTPGMIWHEEYGYPTEIKCISDMEWIRLNADTSQTGKPEIYRISNMSVSSQVNSIVVRLWPVPDSSSYTIYDSYYARATDMSADADVPVFPIEFDELLIMMAVQKARKFQEDALQDQLIVRDIKDEIRNLMRWDDTQVENYLPLKSRSFGANRTIRDNLNFPI